MANRTRLKISRLKIVEINTLVCLKSNQRISIIINIPLSILPDHCLLFIKVLTYLSQLSSFVYPDQLFFI